MGEAQEGVVATLVEGVVEDALEGVEEYLQCLEWVSNLGQLRTNH